MKKQAKTKKQTRPYAGCCIRLTFDLHGEVGQTEAEFVAELERLWREDRNRMLQLALKNPASYTSPVTFDINVSGDAEADADYFTGKTVR